MSFSASKRKKVNQKEPLETQFNRMYGILEVDLNCFQKLT